jgi:hypothetical protein
MVVFTHDHVRYYGMKTGDVRPFSCLARDYALLLRTRNASAPRLNAPEISKIAIVRGSRAPVFGMPGTVGTGVVPVGVTSTVPDVGPTPPLTFRPIIGVTLIEPDVAGIKLGATESTMELPIGANEATSQVTATVTVDPAPTTSGEAYPNVFAPLTIDGTLVFSGIPRFMTLRARQSARCEVVNPPPRVMLSGNEVVWILLPVPACRVTSARRASGVPTEIRGVAFSVTLSDVPDGAVLVLTTGVVVVLEVALVVV